jgi:REP element-mobilizing transposase RayT
MRRPELPRRRSLRLPTYDYRLEGAYSVTTVCAGRRCLFGEVSGEHVRLNDLGRLVEDSWTRLPSHFSAIALDAFVVMPNHVHGVVVVRRETPLSPPLGLVVGAFKAGCSRRAGRALWQRGYYDRVVRDEEELRAIRQYIVDNPCKWAFDRANPARRGDVGR